MPPFDNGNVPYTAPNSMFIPALDEKPKFDVLLFLQNALVLVALLFLFQIINARADELNQQLIGIFRPGGIMLTGLFLLIIYVLWNTAGHLLENHSKARRAIKWGIFLGILLLGIVVYVFPQPFVVFYNADAVQSQVARMEPVRIITGYEVQYNKTTPTGAAVGVSDQYSLNASAIAQKIHALINIERQKQSLNQIGYDAQLEAIAQAHSKDMLSRNFFDHVSPNGDTFISRYQNAKYHCEIILPSETILGGENLSQTYVYNSKYPNGLISDYKSGDQIAQEVVKGWMDSIDHRSNILHAYWRNEGIGVAIEIGGRVLVTQNFC